LRFSDAKRIRIATRATRSICRRRGFCTRPEWRFSRSGTSCVWLAIRTSRSYLSATNVRLEHIRILDRACERHCGPCPLAGHAPWAPLRPAFRYPHCQWATRDLADRWLIVSAPHSVLRNLHVPSIGGAPGIQCALRRFDPTVPGERMFPFAQDPVCALPPPFISRPFSSGDRRCQLRSSWDATVAEWGGCAFGIRFRS